MRRVGAKDLGLVSTAKKVKLDSFAAGASLVTRTGYDLKTLRAKAATDRLLLATLLVREAKALHANGNLCRTVVSRAYYAMYHAIRAATFLSFGGDDHESHTELPLKLPADFPQHQRWQNALKNARLERNRADYDPYPRRDQEFLKIAEDMLIEADEVVSVSKEYVRKRA